MKDRIAKIVSLILDVPVEQIHEDSSPDTIKNWDSLKHMNLVLALEEEFSVQFSDEQIVNMLSVGLIISTLMDLKGSSTG